MKCQPRSRGVSTLFYTLIMICMVPPTTTLHFQIKAIAHLESFRINAPIGSEILTNSNSSSLLMVHVHRMHGGVYRQKPPTQQPRHQNGRREGQHIKRGALVVEGLAISFGVASWTWWKSTFHFSHRIFLVIQHVTCKYCGCKYIWYLNDIDQMTIIATQSPREKWGKQRSWDPSPEWSMIDVPRKKYSISTSMQRVANASGPSICHVEWFRKNGRIWTDHGYHKHPQTSTDHICLSLGT